MLRRCGLRGEAVNLPVEDVVTSHVHTHVFPRSTDDDFVIDADCEPGTGGCRTGGVDVARRRGLDRAEAGDTCWESHLIERFAVFLEL